MNAATSIVIYGSEYCSFCTAARMLLKKKGLDYSDILVTDDPDARSEMIERSGNISVPQIFINGESIGGFDELFLLEQNGELNKLIGRQNSAANDEL